MSDTYTLHDTDTYPDTDALSSTTYTSVLEYLNQFPSKVESWDESRKPNLNSIFKREEDGFCILEDEKGELCRNPSAEENSTPTPPSSPRDTLHDGDPITRVRGQEEAPTMTIFRK